MYILGGATEAGGVASTRQAFMIDLAASWNASAPVYKKLPDGPLVMTVPSAISSDSQNWVTIAQNITYVYNFQSANWSTIITDSTIGPISDLPSGYSATTDPDTGFIYAPGFLKVNGSSMMRLDIRTKSFRSIPMYPSIANGNLFSVVWSAAHKSMFYLGGFTDGLYVYSPSKGWSNPTTKGAVPIPRMKPCLVSVDGGKKLIVVGGYSRVSSMSLSDVYILDVATLTWTAGPSVPLEQTRDTGACGVSNNQLIMWGGIFNDPLSSLLVGITPLIFDITANKWTTSYNAPPKPTPSTTSISQTPTGSAPTSSPSTTPTNGDDGVSLIIIILAIVIGVLIVMLIAGGLWYRSRSKRSNRTNGEKGSSLDRPGLPHKDTYPEDLGYIPPPSSIPYSLPPAPVKANNWTTNPPQSDTYYYNPEAEKQHWEAQNTLIQVDPNAMGRPHEGVYGAQRYSQHPHGAPAEMYEVNNNSQQVFINRRGPAGFNDSVKVYYDSRPRTSPFDRVYEDRGMMSFASGSFFQGSN
ncbi:MAG: hypothetical protein J3Q66DRAFT_438308 [Benniella sp.]|nr:MAG: hypothetical protein J3Q66DRAFT_438308 [Benniella sp.]